MFTFIQYRKILYNIASKDEPICLGYKLAELGKSIIRLHESFF